MGKEGRLRRDGHEADNQETGPGKERDGVGGKVADTWHTKWEAVSAPWEQREVGDKGRW